MASGHVNRIKGRTHGCTDQLCDVKILLANSEPSTHGPSRRFRHLRYFRFGWERTLVNRMPDECKIGIEVNPKVVLGKPIIRGTSRYFRAFQQCLRAARGAARATACHRPRPVPMRV